SRDAALGFFDQADFNSVLLAGEGSHWSINSNLNIGVFGNSNSFSLLSGATASAQNVYLGASALIYPPAGFASDGNLLVLIGTDSTLSVTSNLWVGYRGLSNLVAVRD